MVFQNVKSRHFSRTFSGVMWDTTKMWPTSVQPFRRLLDIYIAPQSPLTCYTGVYILSKNYFPPPLLKIIFCTEKICAKYLRLYFSKLGKRKIFWRKSKKFWKIIESPVFHFPPPPGSSNIILKKIHPCHDMINTPLSWYDKCTCPHCRQWWTLVLSFNKQD